MKETMKKISELIKKHNSFVREIWEELNESQTIGGQLQILIVISAIMSMLTTLAFVEIKYRNVGGGDLLYTVLFELVIAYILYVWGIGLKYYYRKILMSVHNVKGVSQNV